ncbi:MAG: undecaprenyl phosphate translocase family protein, partial [Candidatus Cryptobacteroides sp.]
MKQFLSIVLKGFGMGAANVVPGVSGGTIALITGIYSRLIACISSFASVKKWKLFFTGNFKQWWKEVDGNFLFALFVGLVLSILSLAKLVTWAL